MQQLTIIDGQKMSLDLLFQVRQKISNHMLKPRLDIVFIGANTASEVYIQKKIEAANKVGIKVEVHKYDADVKYAKVSDDLTGLSTNNDVHGIIIQLPAPFVKNSNLLEFIEPRKDVDGLNPYTQGLILQDKHAVKPATCRAIMRVIQEAGRMNGMDFESYIAGKKVCIINRSVLLGKPLAAILINTSATVSVAHSRTQNIAQIVRISDIVVTATGKRDIIDPIWLKDDALLIDAGFTKTNDEVSGDIDAEKFKHRRIILSPVPGGVGPLGVAYLLDNTVESAILLQNKWE